MKGSTIKRGSTWTAYWSTTDPATGKRRQHTKGGFRTQREARAHLNGLLERVEAGAWRPDAKLTVAQLLEEHWLPAQVSRRLRPATIAQYQWVIGKRLVPAFGAQAAQSLTPAKVREMLDDMAARGLSGRSQQLAVGVLQSAYRWAARNDLIARNPIAGLERPKVSTPRMPAWTVEEARSFLAATANDRLAAVWALALTRGLRRGELAGLNWSDVDLDAGTLHVGRTRILVNGKAAESMPKTDAGRRTVPLDGDLVALLRRHKATQAAERLAAGSAYQDGGWLVADELGVPYYPGNLTVWFEARAQALGLRRIRLHDCRHTAATLLLAAGTPVPVVAELLGHANPTITMSVYAHAVPGMGRRAGAELSAALLGAGAQ